MRAVLVEGWAEHLTGGGTEDFRKTTLSKGFALNVNKEMMW